MAINVNHPLNLHVMLNSTHNLVNILESMYFHFTYRTMKFQIIIEIFLLDFGLGQKLLNSSGFIKTAAVGAPLWLSSNFLTLPTNSNIECGSYCHGYKSHSTNEEERCNSFSFENRACYLAHLPYLEEIQANIEQKVRKIM